MEKRIKQYCIKHPSVYAEARCRRCSVPLCDDCKLVEGGAVFCSRKCADEFLDFRQRKSDLDARSRKPSFDISGWLYRLVVFGVLAAAGYYVFIAKHVRSVGEFKELIQALIKTFGG